MTLEFELRVIKFRVWDKKRQTMYYGHQLYAPNAIDFNGNILETGWCDSDDVSAGEYINLVEKDRCVLMQYTGVNDCNGKKIYEGDIVRIKIPPNSKGVAYTGIVEFNEGSYGVRVEGFKFLILDWYISGGMEVIGNVFENPELLKDKDTKRWE